MFIHYRSLGLILKKEDRGETDQLFTIYTKNFGKLEILGKAVRKISSKLKPGAEVFYLSEIEFIQGKAYKTLTDTILIDKFENLRKDYNPPTASSRSAGPLKRLRVANKISEILDNLIKGQERDEKIWQLLIEIFIKLNSPSLIADHLLLIYYYFLWNILSILGYHPELYNCAICQKKITPEKIYFSLKEGGIICQNCFKKDQNTKEVKPEIVKILRIILKKNWKLLFKIKIEPEYLKSLRLISENYLSSIFEAVQ